MKTAWRAYAKRFCHKKDFGLFLCLRKAEKNAYIMGIRRSLIVTNNVDTEQIVEK